MLYLVIYKILTNKMSTSTSMNKNNCKNPEDLFDKLNSKENPKDKAIQLQILKELKGKNIICQSHE